MNPSGKYSNISKKLQKDNLLFLIILGLWFLLIAYFDPRILSSVESQDSILASLSIVCFVFCINLFWLHGIYHLAIFIFSYFSQALKTPSNELKSPHPKVAILYTTMNDFREEAVLSCLNQDYDNFDVYILDDSTDETVKAQIDKFTSRHPHRLFIIRRGTRESFKAGNLNHALKLIHKKYKYFATSDADGILPKDFIKKLLPYFYLDSSIGFVQANQRSNPKQKDPFAKDLSFNNDLHWRHYLPAKNYFGFVMFYGHGALIRTDVWNEVGGFPDTITEDLTFSSIIRERGYKGIFVEDVICYEDFPENYTQFRKRNERWVKGTTEYLIRWFPSLVRSNKLPWFEKLDVLISAGVLLMAVPFLFFLFVVGVAIPLSTQYFSLHIPFMTSFAPISSSVPSYTTLGITYYVNWTFDFFLVMTVTVFSQLIPAIFDLINKPLKMFRYSAQFTFVCLSMIVSSTINVCSFLLTKKSYFPVTGYKDTSLRREERLTTVMELLIATALFFTTVKTSNLWLSSVAFSLFLNPLVYNFKWNSPAVYLLIHLPFVIILILLFLISITFL